MADYKISDTTLTSIGDAIRRKVGETRIEQVPVENPFNFSFNTEDYDLNEFPNMSATMKIITIPITVPTTVKSFKFVYNSSKSYMDNPTLKRLSSAGSLVDARTLYVTSSEYSVEMNLNEGEYLVFEQTFGTGSIELSRYQIDGMFYFYDNDKSLITYDNVEIRNVYTPQQMAQTIDDIPPAPPEEAYHIRNGKYAFTNGIFDWFLDANMEKITTDNLQDTTMMFNGTKVNKPFIIELNYKDGGGAVETMFANSDFTSIPSIDFKQNNTYYSCNGLFNTATELKEIGTLKNLYPSNMSNLFQSCFNLRYLPKFENLNLSRMQTYAYANMGNMFENCYSLREIPEDFLKQLYGIQTSYSYLAYGYLKGCYSLNEIKGINPKTGAMTSNIWSNSMQGLSRVKNIMFALQDDGTPFQVNWKSQTIDLTRYVGYTNYTGYILNYNSGITADKEVKDDATYQALKDNPDWFTTLPEYSRYNHDSAVNTINSLPIITATGTTNTIKFLGAAGSKTDGGAINTLTEEEIAVAASKGWTVSFA